MRPRNETRRGQHREKRGEARQDVISVHRRIFKLCAPPYPGRRQRMVRVCTRRDYNMSCRLCEPAMDAAVNASGAHGQLL